MVNEDIALSRLYRDDEDSRPLAELAEGTPAWFLATGWVQDAEPETPSA